eukprot:scaffold2140_cov394-Prasinococcus_capsulatus_cf.AAC.19
MSGPPANRARSDNIMAWIPPHEVTRRHLINAEADVQHPRTGATTHTMPVVGTELVPCLGRRRRRTCHKAGRRGS